MRVNDSRDRKNFFSAVQRAYKELEPFRLTRTAMIRDMAGQYYGSTPSKNKKLVNLMLQTIEAFTVAMIANAPRCGMSTRQQGLYEFASRFEYHTNLLAEEIRVEETLQDVVRQSFFGPGLIKTFMGDSAPVMLENDLWMDPGQPFVESLSLDKWVHDVGAKDLRRCQFIGDVYRVPFDSLEDQSLYNPKAVASLKPGSKFDTEGDKAQAISTGDAFDPDEYRPMIDLADFWIPENRAICTYAVDAQFNLLDGPPLVERDWDGSDTGPYDMLNMGNVPDNILPTSPAENLKNLHDLYNSLLRKLDAQARRQKNIVVCDKKDVDDVKNFKNAGDGQTVAANNPEAAKELRFGGIDAGNMGFSVQVQQIYDRMAGNLQTKAGLGATAPTATQEQIIAGQVAEMSAAAGSKLTALTTRIFKQLARLLWKDKYRERKAQVPADGTPYLVDADWTRDDRQGSFEDYALEIYACSMPHRSPTERATMIDAEVQKILPLMGAPPGSVSFDIISYVRMKARMLNLPELLQVFKIDVAPMEREGDAGNVGKPANTTRTNIRKSIAGGPTPDARAHEQMQAYTALAQTQQQGAA